MRLYNILDGAMHDAVPAIAALGVSPIVRIPDMQGWMVKSENLPFQLDHTWTSSSFIANRSLDDYKEHWIAELTV